MLRGQKAELELLGVAQGVLLEDGLRQHLLRLLNFLLLV